jgi:hypothetical protein
MLKNKLWSGTAAEVEQGGNNITFNSVHLMQRNGDVLFGGSATVRIAGEYFME